MRNRLITRGTLGQRSFLLTAKDFISVVLESCLRQYGEEFQEVVMSCYYCGSEGFIKTDQSRKIYSQRLQAKQFVLAVYSYLKSCINRDRNLAFMCSFLCWPYSLSLFFLFFFFFREDLFLHVSTKEYAGPLKLQDLVISGNFSFL